MAIVLARIHLYTGPSARSTPFKSGYRPCFGFVPESLTSGSITLLDRELFYPGDTGEVKITFLSEELLGENFGSGTTFEFGEGPRALGRGEILEVLSRE